MTTKAEFLADGTIRLLTPLPEELKPGLKHIALMVWEEDEETQCLLWSQNNAEDAAIAMEKALKKRKE